MAMAMENKEHQLRLDVQSDPPPSDPRVPFFGRRRRQRHESTWAASLFVLALLVAFVATMFVNDCPGGSGECLVRPLGRFSFQPLYENPLLGPSSSTLLKMGALQRTSIPQRKKIWRLVSFPWLHAGVVHLLVNLSSIIFVGVRLEQEFGPLRAAIIYLLSALTGSMTSTIFVQHAPAVGASGALFGLIGAMLSGMFRNWNKYSGKFSALVLLGSLAAANLTIGMLPRVDNFANIGGLVSGILLGFVLLFDPLLSALEQNKGIFDYDLSASVKLKQKLDKPASRILTLLLFIVLLAGVSVAAFRGVDMSTHCAWCRYVNCIPTEMWSCNEKASHCEVRASDGRLTLTCSVGDKFATYPIANVSQGRMDDLCSLICS